MIFKNHKQFYKFVIAILVAMSVLLIAIFSDIIQNPILSHVSAQVECAPDDACTPETQPSGCWACGGEGPLGPEACGHFFSYDEAAEVCPPTGDPDDPDTDPPGGPPTPIDYVECTQVTDPEFHSMRPYRASPCNTALQNISMYCSNDMLLKEDFDFEPSEADRCTPVGILNLFLLTEMIANTPVGTPISFTCEYDIERGNALTGEQGVEVGVDLSDAELPFMGNTQLVPNQQNNGSPSPTNLDYAQRMNFYISWYLNGIPYRAEEEPVNIEDDLVQPPINVNDGSELLTTFGGPIKKLLPDEIQIRKRNQISNRLGASGPGSNAQHNQIVRCGSRDNPIPCTPPDNTTRLSETNGEDDYVPFSSMEDRIGTLEIDLTHTIQPTSNEENDLIFTTPPSYHPADGEFTNDIGFPEVGRNADLLFFAHMLENNELEEFLQQTYIPLGINQIVSDDEKNEVGLNYYNTNRCDLENARWNSGDDLLGELEPPDAAGDIRYAGHFSCDYTLDTTCYAECFAASADAYQCLDQCTPTCEKSSVVALSVYTRSPLAEENWSRLVASKQSIFKRFMPRIVPLDDGTGSIVAEFQDLPGVTTAHYYSNTNNIDVFAGNLTRSGDRANIFIPHLGGINEYFQIQLQKALRPKREEPLLVPVPGNQPPPVGGRCDLSTARDGVWSGHGLDAFPEPIQGVIEAAADKYNMPVCVLTAIASVEGSRMTLLTDAEAADLTREWRLSPENEISSELYDKINCSPNFAGAQGPMQMTSTAFNPYKNASGSQNPSVCNARDAIFAAAEFLVQGRLPIYGYDYPQTSSDWRNGRIYCAAGETYYGSCRLDAPTCNNLGTNYCDFVLNHCRQSAGIADDVRCAQFSGFEYAETYQ